MGGNKRGLFGGQTHIMYCNDNEILEQEMGNTTSGIQVSPCYNVSLLATKFCRFLILREVSCVLESFGNELRMASTCNKFTFFVREGDVREC